MPTTYYSCTTTGCITTTATTMYTTLPQCQNVCTRWGCNANVINEDTNIYVFYDISSMDMSWLHNAHEAVTDWVTTGIPGFTGNIYHTLDERELWLQYDYIIYSGNVAGNTSWVGGQTNSLFQSTLSNYDSVRDAMGWKQLEVAAGNTWYDMFKSSSSPHTIVGGPYAGNVVTASGIPPMSDYSDNVLVITFNDESAPAYHGTSKPWGTQPKAQWISDYDNYTGASWTGIQAAGGKINQFLYIANSGDTSYNYNCSMEAPCTVGPIYGEWIYGNGLNGTIVDQIVGYEIITTTFQNIYNATVAGCTGVPGASSLTNPNPCPPSWQNTGCWSTPCTPATSYANPLGNQGLNQYYQPTNEAHALQAMASISSGNKTNINGTWQLGSAPTKSNNPYVPGPPFLPTSSLSNIVNMGYGLVYDVNVPNLENENPYWVDFTGSTINLTTNANPIGPVTNHGALDQYGWGVNVEAIPFTGPNLAAGINSFLAQGFTAQTLCTSAETSNASTFPYTTWDDCNSSDGCGKYTCGPTGCIPWSIGEFDSLSSCTATCFSYECRASGCTSIAGSGGTYFVSGSTQDSLTACTATCYSYECRSSGCTEIAGSGATFQTSATCTASCISYACTDDGCTTFPGTGNTPYSAQSSCITACVSWNCSPTGCVQRTGTGGTYTELSACTEGCVSYGCTDTGCTQQTGTGGTYFNTSRPQDSLTACTASCVSYYCTDTGCTQQTGSGATHFNSGKTQDALTACTASCTSYSCTTTGCVETPGSGGTYYKPEHGDSIGKL